MVKVRYILMILGDREEAQKNFFEIINNGSEEEWFVVSAYYSLGQLNEIYSDRKQLFLVIKNLIENSIKYKDKSRPEIKIMYKTDEEFDNIPVIDNGIGYEKEYADQIFKMFKRLNNREAYAGSDLGLSISKKMVENLGGSLYVEKVVVGEGVTFAIKLPKIHLFLRRKFS